ncbi:hypothetical protein [Thermococcus sp.]
MNYVAASTQRSDDAYDDFWKILNREAELIVSLNSTNNITEIQNLSQELIQNSRLGEENAVNISTQVWQALEELKASGVKTYYTAEELRRMAENISVNGLPNETVQELKAQGWSDEQIQALEEYITKNKDNITTGFNMTSFLENFSTAFVRVGFKYASYESWALEKWKWYNSTKFTGSFPSNKSINPLLAEEWVNFYSAYAEGNTTKLLKAINALSSKTYNLLTFSSPFTTTAEFMKNGKFIQRHESVEDLKLYAGGFAVITAFSIYLNNSKKITVKDVYYWPTALQAYNLTRQIYVLVQAMKLGNDNPELQWFLNQKIDELKKALVVHISESVTEQPLKIGPNPLPPGPLPPIQIEPPKQPIGSFSTSGSGNLSSSEESNETVSCESPSVSIPTAVEKQALSIDDNEGRLSVSGINVVIDSSSSTQVRYHVEVTLTAENNAVSNITLSVSDYTSSDYDRGSISSIFPGDSISWSSKEFSVSPSGSSVSITGEVSVTYTPSCGDTPTSSPVTPSTSSTTCYEPHTITKSYSKTVHVQSSIDPSKVSFEVVPSETSINIGDSVEFYVKVRNDNNESISGGYSLTIAVPQPDAAPYPKTFSGSVTVPAHSSKTVSVTRITYGQGGTFNYHGSFDFGVSSKEDNGYITVTSSGSSGSLWIEGVTYDPLTPRDGGLVNFTVKVKSSYSSSQSVGLELYIDGSKVDSVSGSVGAGSTKSFTLHWLAQTGEHSYLIKLYNLIGGQKFEEDENSGGINVVGASQQFAVSLDAFPEELEGGGMVVFTVRVRNFENTALSLSGFVEDEDGAVIKRIGGLEGRIPANGGKNITFSYTVYGVGNHTFKVFLDNYDGKPNGKGEEHWSEATVEVKPVGNVIANMSCDPAIVPLDSSTTCTINFESKSADTVTLNLEEVDFGGKKVWPDGPSSVVVPKKTVTLTPTNMQEDLTVTITVNDELANYYFGKPVYRTYIDKFAGHSYLVEVKFDSLGYPISDAITVVYKDTRSRTDKAIDYGSTAGEIVSTVQLAAEGSNPLGWVVFGLTSLPKIGKGISEIQFIFELGVNGFQDESDNNSVVGG